MRRRGFGRCQRLAADHRLLGPARSTCRGKSAPGGRRRLAAVAKVEAIDAPMLARSFEAGRNRRAWTEETFMSCMRTRAWVGRLSLLGGAGVGVLNRLVAVTSKRRFAAIRRQGACRHHRRLRHGAGAACFVGLARPRLRGRAVVASREGRGSHRVSGRSVRDRPDGGGGQHDRRRRRHPHSGGGYGGTSPRSPSPWGRWNRGARGQEAAPADHIEVIGRVGDGREGRRCHRQAGDRARDQGLLGVHHRCHRGWLQDGAYWPSADKTTSR
jgi:hypothetical protein